MGDFPDFDLKYDGISGCSQDDCAENPGLEYDACGEEEEQEDWIQSSPCDESLTAIDFNPVNRCVHFLHSNCTCLYPNVSSLCGKNLDSKVFPFVLLAADLLRLNVRTARIRQDATH